MLQPLGGARDEGGLPALAWGVHPVWRKGDGEGITP